MVCEPKCGLLSDSSKNPLESLRAPSTMLRWMGPPIRLCEGLSRRDILRVGGMGLGGGLDLNQIFANDQASDNENDDEDKDRNGAKDCDADVDDYDPHGFLTMVGSLKE